MKNNKKNNNSVTISPAPDSVPILPTVTDAPENIILPISPIKTYSNAEDNKDKILSDNTNKSGIYK